MYKLRRSHNSIFGGVCAGLAESLKVDPTIVRLIWAVSAFMGFGILLYIICWIIIPLN